jgi:hypothetical protein
VSPLGRPLTVNLYQVLVTGLEIVYGDAADQLDRVELWVPIVVLVPPLG